MKCIYEGVKKYSENWKQIYREYRWLFEKQRHGLADIKGQYERMQKRQNGNGNGSDSGFQKSGESSN